MEYYLQVSLFFLGWRKKGSTMKMAEEAVAVQSGHDSAPHSNCPHHSAGCTPLGTEGVQRRPDKGQAKGHPAAGLPGQAQWKTPQLRAHQAQEATPRLQGLARHRDDTPAAGLLGTDCLGELGPTGQQHSSG